MKARRHGGTEARRPEKKRRSDGATKRRRGRVRWRSDASSAPARDGWTSRPSAHSSASACLGFSGAATHLDLHNDAKAAFTCLKLLRTGYEHAARNWARLSENGRKWRLGYGPWIRGANEKLDLLRQAETTWDSAGTRGTRAGT